MHESGFVQLVDSPTRSQNISDLFFTNKSSLVQQCHVVSGISDYETDYKELKKTMHRECRKAFKNYMSNAICDPYQSGKKKKLYRYVKSLRSDYCGLGTLCKDGTDYVDNQAKVNLLNTQFSSVFTMDDDLVLPNMGTNLYPNIPTIEFDIPGIVKLLSELDPSKSPEPDHIPVKSLKPLAAEIALYLNLLFSASLHQGKVPLEWKKALVCPLFKKGNRRDPLIY